MRGIQTEMEFLGIDIMTLLNRSGDSQRSACLTVKCLFTASQLDCFSTIPLRTPLVTLL